MQNYLTYRSFFYDSGRTDETLKSPDRGLTTTGPGQIGSGVPSVSWTKNFNSNNSYKTYFISMIKWGIIHVALVWICSENLEYIVSQIGVVHSDDHGSSACLGEYY